MGNDVRFAPTDEATRLVAAAVARLSGMTIAGFNIDAANTVSAPAPSQKASPEAL
jgi:hypothetical protein